MAKLKSSYTRAAEAMGSYKGSMYSAMAEQDIGNIKSKSILDKVNRQQELLNLAAEGVRTAEIMSGERENEAEIVSGVAMAEKQTGETVDYNKTTFKDFLKGDARFRDVGKETYKFGDTEYTGNDLQAIHKSGLTNKFESYLAKNPDGQEELISPYNPKAKTSGWTYGQQTRDYGNVNSAGEAITSFDNLGITLQEAMEKARNDGTEEFRYNGTIYGFVQGKDGASDSMTQRSIYE